MSESSLPPSSELYDFQVHVCARKVYPLETERAIVNVLPTPLCNFLALVIPFQVHLKADLREKKYIINIFIQSRTGSSKGLMAKIFSFTFCMKFLTCACTARSCTISSLCCCSLSNVSWCSSDKLCKLNCVSLSFSSKCTLS